MLEHSNVYNIMRKMAASSNVIEFHFLFKVLYELYSITCMFSCKKIDCFKEYHEPNISS